MTAFSQSLDPSKAAAAVTTGERETHLSLGHSARGGRGWGMDG